MNEPIHIVCLDAPAPPDYGGAIDMYYTIIALAKTGRKPILHYFEYGEKRSVRELEPFCSAIHAYPRKSLLKSFSLTKPYIVTSRINRNLIDRLNQDQHPILLEGLHCTGILPGLRNTERVVVRMHNEEASYYQKLAENEKSFLKRIYYNMESSLLSGYYSKIPKTTTMACLAITDIHLLKEHYQFSSLHFIPCFIPWQEIRSPEGKGQYCLYHGNLGVAENEAAAAWLISKVFSKMDLPLVIAGKGISKFLEAMSGKYTHIRIEKDPSMEKLDQLVRDAQVHVLPSFNCTGVKLKLLHALMEGRHCLTNEEGVQGSGIENMVAKAGSAEEFRALCRQLFDKPFTLSDKKNRQEILTVYNNEINAGRLSALWSHYQ